MGSRVLFGGESPSFVLPDKTPPPPNTVLAVADGKVAWSDELSLSSIGLNYVLATQTAGDLTNPVTIDGYQGYITTADATVAAGGSTTFNLINNTISFSSVIVKVVGYTGTWGSNGWPLVHSFDSSETSCQITVTNLHPTNALSGALTIGFWVMRENS